MPLERCHSDSDSPIRGPIWGSGGLIGAAPTSLQCLSKCLGPALAVVVLSRSDLALPTLDGLTADQAARAAELLEGLA